VANGFDPVTVENISNFGFLKELQILPITVAAQSSARLTEAAGLKIAMFKMHFCVSYVFCRPVYARAIQWSDHAVKQPSQV
jgi:hypothetical protein